MHLPAQPLARAKFVMSRYSAREIAIRYLALLERGRALPEQAHKDEPPMST
jgi:hypothetical protein